MRRVLVLGSLNIDDVLSVPHIPRPGETLKVSSSSAFPGGKGLNQSVACSMVLLLLISLV
jgi:ribokinase